MPTRLEAGITKRVIEARERAGLERKDLAQALSMDSNSYGHYERGRYAFTIDHLFTLSRVLNRSVEWLLGLENGLSEEEDELVMLYRAMPESVRPMALGAMRAMAEGARGA